MLMALALLLFQAPEVPQFRPDEPAKTEVVAEAVAPAPADKGTGTAKSNPKTATLPSGYSSFRNAKDLNKFLSANGENESTGATPVPVATVSPLWATRQEQRTPKLWFALAGAGPSAAAFDAYSTRRVIQRGQGRELNPLMKPFAASNALYFATQAQPALLDFVGLRMLHSNKRWVRRMWWVPQVAGTAASLWAGAHNMRISHGSTLGLVP